MRRYVVFTQILGHKITAAIVDDSILMQSSPDARIVTPRAWLFAVFSFSMRRAASSPSRQRVQI